MFTLMSFCTFDVDFSLITSWSIDTKATWKARASRTCTNWPDVQVVVKCSYHGNQKNFKECLFNVMSDRHYNYFYIYLYSLLYIDNWLNDSELDVNKNNKNAFFGVSSWFLIRSTLFKSKRIRNPWGRWCFIRTMKKAIIAEFFFDLTYNCLYMYKTFCLRW